MERLRRALDWTFRSRVDGRITIAQWPNLPLWLFLGLAAAGRILAPAGGAGTALRVAADLAFAWWALDEVLRGVNPWRRVLGAAALAGYALLRLWGS
ncbi:hypothetical protein [Methylobacterium dankookense]|uniref:Glycine/betaine ABC transporter permease n=1 Tax=Methylobacterium dankookense TaxID=560405 RepID=A0A564G2V9_9HYPH|nr:hypothetical protein [Methylobacterium dankookense]GJD57048.1 hypothetical protein IFDJLNFL_2948 [Methylobacterium dankookense]VUF14597.1 hypothetical protein MTDSW087_04322 [Methylobacterium dankookense]